MIHSLSSLADHHPCSRRSSSSQDEAAVRIQQSLTASASLRIFACDSLTQWQRASSANRSKGMSGWFRAIHSIERVMKK